MVAVMAHMMVIVSKGIFEKEAKGVEEGQVWPTSLYASQSPALAALKPGGDLYLVTVRPPDERLWLVAVLRGPKKEKAGWRAKPNTTPIVDITHLKRRIAFASGAGITAKPGALGMSLQTPRALTSDDVALLSGGGATPSAPVAKAASRPGDVGARLLAAVLDRPHDLTLRSVYGDWLSEQGEPRGEVIALQSNGDQASKEDRKRLEALISAHGAKWIAPLDEIVRDPQFRLGFLSGCTMVKLRSKAHRALLAHPLFSTLEDAGRDEKGEVVTAPGLRSVRRVTTTLAGLAHMAAAPHTLPLEEAEFEIHLEGLPGSLGSIEGPEYLLDENPHWSAVANVGRLGQLRTLGFDAHGTSRSVCGPEQYTWLLEAPLMRQLTRLKLERCTTRWVHLRHWLEVLERFPTLQQLEFSLASWEGQPSGRGHEQRLVLTRAGKNGLEVRIELTNRADHLVPKVFTRVMQSALADVPASFPSRISVRLTGSRKTKQELAQVRADIEAVLGRHFTSVQFEEPGFDLS